MKFNLTALLAVLKTNPAGVVLIGNLFKTMLTSPSSIGSAITLSKNLTWAGVQAFLVADEAVVVAGVTQVVTVLAENPALLAAIVSAL